MGGEAGLDGGANAPAVLLTDCGCEVDEADMGRAAVGDVAEAVLLLFVGMTVEGGMTVSGVILFPPKAIDEKDS